MKFKPQQTGIELIVGRPGSGKSLYAVREALRCALEERRPVYTNLPLKLRVVRQYLRNRGGVEATRLIQPFDHSGFARFIDRYERRTAFERDLSERGVLSRRERRDRWRSEAGADVTTGPELDWIPAGSVIIFDEVHHAYPNPALQRGSKTDREPKALLSYLTMHRHLQHRLIFITQAERQVSQTIKSLVHLVWHAHPRDDDRIAWGIRFKHVGLKGLGYLAYTPELDPERDQPVESFTIYPGWPFSSYREIFRFYESFTHAGSARELKAGLREARLEAGLDERGRVVQDESEEEDVAKKKGIVRRVVGGTVRLGMWTAAAIIAVGIGGVIAGSVDGQDDEVLAELERLGGRLTALEQATVDVLRNSDAAGGGYEWIVKGMTKDAVVLDDGRRIGVGGVLEDLRLVGVNAGGGRAVAEHVRSGDVWMLAVSESPWRLGSAEQVRGALERASRSTGPGGNGGAQGAVVGAGRGNVP